jgi:hypothetical protein
MVIIIYVLRNFLIGVFGYCNNAKANFLILGLEKSPARCIYQMPTATADLLRTACLFLFLCNN